MSRKKYRIHIATILLLAAFLIFLPGLVSQVICNWRLFGEEVECSYIFDNAAWLWPLLWLPIAFVIGVYLDSKYSEEKASKQKDS